MEDDKKSSAGTAFDIEAYAQVGLTTSLLREPVNRNAIQALQLPSGSRSLDAGGEIGLQALLLAMAVGPAGHVTILDLSPELLDYAEENAKDTGLAERFSFKLGDIAELPFDDNTNDWAEYQRLCQPESDDFILDQPDYYAFFTYSMFSGMVVN